MRTVFNQALLEEAQQRGDVHLVLADIGYGEVEPFAEALPQRYLNVGVAEQNMTGVACGIAMEGNIAITYSIANFPTLRCLEQIRNDVCYHNANVKIVIIGGGLAYGPLGISHHSSEDLAIMRALPNIVVVAPSDFAEARGAVRAMLAFDGPVYYRCGYKNEPAIHDGPVDLQFGKALQVSDGTDATIIFTGTIGYQAKLAAEQLAGDGIHCRLLSMHTIKPIDREAILAAATETGAVFTLEEHVRSGGLGSAVAEVLADANVWPKRFQRLSLPDVAVSEVGTQPWLLAHYGLDADSVARAVRQSLSRTVVTP